ncbi:hypothetical protein FNV43_RR07442 [Rhamnella rubrinervis]|uniref:Uncharacterized protein n=1 Tax=Rhamnella rubrinervis TaxID=2594499 RepID=A0A8K0HEZ0_9ROSA|nr:hypothetical protein FNV43_RR07442 [Rhamnella rubrinervis]
MPMKESIQLPNIVVVGYQSSSKFSVLESLAGISLPRGYCAYTKQTVPIDEAHISEAITLVTNEITGNGERTLSVVSKEDKAPEGLLEKVTVDYNKAFVTEATVAFMQITGLVKESLRKVLLRDEFDEYPKDRHMDCIAHLIEMLNMFSNQLHNSIENDLVHYFLMEKIRILEEYKEIGLLNFLPHTAFCKERLKVSNIPIDFVGKLWVYIEEVVIITLVEDYYQLQLSIES